MDVKDRVLRHLDRDYDQPIRDPLWQHIFLDTGLLEILHAPAFQQLARIKQLGPAHLVYPGATHTRLAHSLGVFYIARRMVRRLVAHQECPEITLEGVRAFLCAALLHDLGHFPFAHSLKELPLAEHEALGGKMIESEPLASIIAEHVRTDPAMVASIIDLERPIESDGEINLYRKLLSGSLDVDKLDYLNRDAYFCGVPYGIQDIDFTISRIVPNGYNGVALVESGVSSVENILFSKYLMHRAVYWHRTVRSATAMIKKGIYVSLRDGHLTSEELFGLDDESFYAGLLDRSEPEFVLVRGVYDRRLYKPTAEIAFESGRPAHEALVDLEHRAAVEDAIAKELSARVGYRVDPLAVIVDVPEAISFEVSFPVVRAGETVDYPLASTVFTPQVVGDFVRILRKIRLFVSPDVATEGTQYQGVLKEVLSGA